MEFEKTKTLQAEKMKCYNELLDYLNEKINNSIIDEGSEETEPRLSFYGKDYKNIIDLVNKINGFNVKTVNQKIYMAYKNNYKKYYQEHKEEIKQKNKQKRIKKFEEEYKKEHGGSLEGFIYNEKRGRKLQSNCLGSSCIKEEKFK